MQIMFVHVLGFVAKLFLWDFDTRYDIFGANTIKAMAIFQLSIVVSLK